MVPTLLSSASLNYFTDRLLMEFSQLLTLFIFLSAIAAWVYTIAILVRREQPKVARTLRIAFLVLLILAIGMTVFYLVNLLHDNGADCTFDNIECQSNIDFGGVVWGVIFCGILLFMNIVLLILARI